MGKGYLRINTVSTDEANAIDYASVFISDENSHTIYETHTDKNGITYDIPLSAPDKSHSLNPAYHGPVFSRYNVLVRADGYRPIMYEGVSIFDTITTIQKIIMEPGNQDQEIKHVNVGKHTLDRTEEQRVTEQAIRSEFVPNVIIGYASRGNNVLHIQQAINRLAEVYTGRLWKIKEDSIFGNGTRNAVMAFQRLFNLKEDGLVGPITWSTLMLEAFNHHKDSDIYIQSADVFGRNTTGNKNLSGILNVMLANRMFTGFGKR